MKRPEFPRQADRLRIESQSKRLAMLLDLPELDDYVKDWLNVYIDETRQSQWGPPDTSVVVIADISRQLTTPGCYGAAPEISHADPAGQVLVDAVAATNTWQLLQMALYCSFGIGSYVTHHAWDSKRERLITRLVRPTDVWAEVDPSDPTIPVAMYELRTHGGDWIWLVSSVKDPEHPFKRVYRHDADGPDCLGADITQDVYGRRYDDDQYPLRDAEKRPVLDYCVRRPRETGDLWAADYMRGAFRGSLHSMVLSTQSLYAARDASASSVILIGVQPVKSRTVQTPDGGHIDRIDIVPGQMLFLQPTKGSEQQPLVVPVGPGMALDSIQRMAMAYEQSQLARFGVARDDVTRSSQNPTSGAALSLSNAEKRAAMKLVQPVLRRADETMLKTMSAVLRSAGTETPDTGYSIVYAEIPPGADELRAQSEQLDARLRRGTMSRVDVYMQDHPGVTREHAISELKRIRREEAEIEAAATITDPNTKPGANAPAGV
jgi:hypothetical protein